MSDRLEDFDFSAPGFEHHKAHPEVSFAQYLEEQSVSFAKCLCARKVIYLDTKFWVKLCNAALGRPREATDVALLASLAESVTDGRVVCPLSSSLWWEIMHQSDETTRLRTAELIDELSLGLTAFTEEDRIGVEAGDLFDTFVLKRQPTEPVRTRVWGFPFCGLGVPFVHSGAWTEADATAIQKTLLDTLRHVGFAEIVKPGSNKARYFKQAVSGVADELNAFRANHKPAPTFEEEYAREFVGALRGNHFKLRDVVELHTLQAFGRRGPISYDALATKFAELILAAFLNQRLGHMFPSLAIPAALHAAFGMDTRRRYKAGDYHDFNHTAIALPYCDCFATDIPLAHLVDDQLHLPQIYGATVVTTSEALLAFISTIGSK